MGCGGRAPTKGGVGAVPLTGWWVGKVAQRGGRGKFCRAVGGAGGAPWFEGGRTYFGFILLRLADSKITLLYTCIIKIT